MNWRDLIGISSGNLKRMKLRTFLTMSGVVIAIAAFVSMLSFGAGMQENISKEFIKLGLFSTMVVYPLDEDDLKDTTETRTEIVPLNDDAVNLLAQIPGVKLAYPYDKYSVEVQYGDSIRTVSAQALPRDAFETKLFSQLECGVIPDSNNHKDILVSEALLREFNIDSSETILNQQIIVTASASVIDSGLVNIIKSPDFDFRERINEIEYDSLFDADYRRRILRSEANDAVKRFIDGYQKAQVKISDTLTVVGVIEQGHGRRVSTRPVIIPMATAKKFNTAGAGKQPLDIFASLGQGDFNLFSSPEETDQNYSRVTLDLEADMLVKNISDSVKTLGFRSFSYAEEFDEIRKFFFYFNMILGVIGLIALVTASLGIINTMVMSIVERKKEIGILKSLGADERYIRSLFLVESGVIGAMGAAFGVLTGWIISRIVSFIAKKYMENEGIDGIELFAVPWWLILISMSIGIVVSLLAGYFPASRASKVDPVEALRND